MMIPRRSLLGLLAGLSAGSAARAQAAPWPSRAVSLVVPFPPGGFTDVIARTVAQALQREVQQSVIVVNRPGAGGNIGAQFVAGSAPDGHTLLVTSHVLTYASLAFRKGGVNLQNTLEPVINLGHSTGFLVTGARSGLTSLVDMVDKARRNPGRVKLATVGGSSGTFPLFLKAVNAEVTLVPYQGNAAAIPGLLSADVDLLIASPDTVAGFVADGSMRILAVASSQTRSKFHPGAPTLIESFPNVPIRHLLHNGFIGLTAPKGTPADTIDAINRAVARTLAGNAELNERFHKAALEVATAVTPQDFGRLITEDLGRAAELLRLTGEYVN